MPQIVHKCWRCLTARVNASIEIAVRSAMWTIEMLQRQVSGAHLCVASGILFAFKGETYNFRGIERARILLLVLLSLRQVIATDISIIGYKAKACRSSFLSIFRIGIYSRTREMRAQLNARRCACVRGRPNRMLLHKRVSMTCYERIRYVGDTGRERERGARGEKERTYLLFARRVRAQCRN